MSDPFAFLDFNPELAERKSFVGTLQTAFDSTSLTSLKRCPREYYYSIVCGVIPAGESVHLKFGIVYHAALEKYDYSRAEGRSHEDAIMDALQYALVNTWEPRLNRPWMSDHETKNRYTLVLTILNKLDHFNDETETLRTVLLPPEREGAAPAPAVELSFSFRTGYQTPYGAEYQYCGHIDRLVEMHGQRFVADNKTTSLPLGENYFSQYVPNNQMIGYHYAGQLLFSEPTAGVIIDAARIYKAPKSEGGEIRNDFHRKIIYYTKGQMDEWHRDLGFWLKIAEAYSNANYWPMNESSCSRGFFKCPYFGICSNAPESRRDWIKTGWLKRSWDPLVSRQKEDV